MCEGPKRCPARKSQSLVALTRSAPRGGGEAFRVSYFHRAYDGGAPEFDFGSPVNSALILASADVKGFHHDACLLAFR